MTRAFLALLFALMAAVPARAIPQPLKFPIYGVTLDDLTKLDAIIQSLVKLPYKPTVRVVFDPDMSAKGDYLAPLTKLHNYAYIVGEIMDSYYYPQTAAQLDARTKELVSVLRDQVDVWEIANEINGEWLRANPSGPTATATTQEQQIGQAVLQTYNTVKAAGGKTMVTLYYNQDPSGENCWMLPIDNWRTWPKQFLSSTVLQGVDYAMFSYYPYQDCPNLKPDWPADFRLLESAFPNAKVGFGEIGTSKLSAPLSVQKNLLTTYYSMINTPPSPRFVGGVFWWNYVAQMLPYTSSSYWSLLYNTMTKLRAPQ